MSLIENCTDCIMVGFGIGSFFVLLIWFIMNNYLKKKQEDEK